MDIFAAKHEKLLTYFQQNINVFTILEDKNFNVTLANNFVKFWIAGPRLSTLTEPQRQKTYFHYENTPIQII